MSREVPVVVELCFLRHAQAGDRETWEQPDELRPLTEKGRRQAERLGRFLAAAGFVPDAVITSPLVRARETAEVVADLLGAAVRIEPRLGEPLDLATVDVILDDAGSPRRPIVVGHDPDFSELVTELVGGAPILMRKGALARIDVERPLEPGAGELRWLLPPDVLRG
ncbi:MAG: histidine phosphatase family protein [Chloroflexota bacterium]